MAFAAVSDVETRLQRTLTSAESAAMAVLLEDASDAIRSVAGGQVIFPAGSETVTLRTGGRRVVYLPQVPVTAVASILDADGVNVTADYLWDRDGAVWRSTGWWRSREVTVAYSYGYAVVPAELKRLCSKLAAELLAVPASGVKSESIGSYSVTYETAAGGSILFSDEDVRTARRFAAQLRP